MQASYGDSVSSLAGGDRPSSRAVSNAVMAQDEDMPSAVGTSDLFWVWGQFLDHDIDLTKGPEAGQEEPANIPVPTGDPFFDPFNTGTQEIGLTRSGFDPSTGTDSDNPREQVNEITSFIDASMIYGSDPATAASLRAPGGKLATSDGDMLPLDGGHFVAGDVRANENVALTSMHTIFMREHNRLVDELAEEHPDYDDERLYQEAKALVEAKIQVITYNEFLPLLLGENALGDYEGYKADVDPSIANIFATAAFRVGHTMLSSTIKRVDEKGEEDPFGHLALRDAFFRPDKLLTEGGTDPILRGLATNVSQEIDTRLVDDVRNFLFGPPGAGGFDLGSLNIQRGRDHGLPSYNEARVAYGLDPVTDFDEITSDSEIADSLEAVYGTVDKIDVFVGGLAEDAVPDALVGELFHAVLLDQFTRLRDGDRFWYEDRFEGETLEELQNTKLADIILANTEIEAIQDQVMLAYNRIGGTHGNDTMNGTWDRDLMLGGDGHDRLKGKENDDQIHGGAGNDKAYGGGGNDKLLGEEGRDKLYGGDGDDWLLGGDDRDMLKGGRGNDKLEGGGDRDHLFGGGGDDTMMGDAGRDRLNGGRGNDDIDGGWDRDVIKAGRGDDVARGGEGRDKISTGRGADEVVYESVLDFGDLITDFDPRYDILDLRPISADADVEISFSQRGYKAQVFAEVDGGREQLVAELRWVHESELSAGSDPSNNILV